MRNTSQQHTPLPACTVVIPAYNASAHIAEAIDSVLQQSYTNWELKVVDDGSSDNTAAQVRTFTDHRIQLHCQNNSGASAARNQGLRMAQADTVLFLDADDCLKPNALARFMQAFAAHPDACAVYGEAMVIEANGQRAGVAKQPVFAARPSGDVLRALLTRNFIATPGVMAIRREAIAMAGAFDESLCLSEDWEAWCRLAQQGPFYYLGPEPVLSYRLSATSFVRTQGMEPTHGLRCVAAIFEQPGLSARLGRALPRLRRKAEASIYSFTATQHVRAHNWRIARGLLWASLCRVPYQCREWILWLLTWLHWLPNAVLRRLK